jgi:hypothetical protein
MKRMKRGGRRGPRPSSVLSNRRPLGPAELDKTPRRRGPGLDKTAAAEDELREALPVHVAGITYQLKLISCGRRRCGRCRGRAPAHGPYWYAYWKVGGKTRCKYIGKKLPEVIRTQAAAGAARGRRGYGRGELRDEMRRFLDDALVDAKKGGR